MYAPIGAMITAPSAAKRRTFDIFASFAPMLAPRSSPARAGGREADPPGGASAGGRAERQPASDVIAS